MASSNRFKIYFLKIKTFLSYKDRTICAVFLFLSNRIILKLFSLKYKRLTKEQLEELQPEFVNFLATQSITGEEWKNLKEEKPAVAEDEIDVFSNLIWEGVLSKVKYLENISTQHMHLFNCAEKEMKLISVKVMNPEIDLTTTIGFNWFKKNWQSDFVEYLTAAKAYTEDQNVDKFNLIEQGAAITKGDLYKWFETMIEVK